MPCNESLPSTLVDKVAASMLQAWEDVEGKPINVSYIATVADMARAVIRDFEVKERG